MAEICVNLVVSAVTEVGKCVVVRIHHQFNYLFRFQTYVESLNQEAEKLESARAKLQELDDEAYQTARVTTGEVKTLLENIGKLQEIKKDIDSKISNVQKSWLAIPSRFSLSKKVKKTTVSMNNLSNSCSSYHNFTDVSVARFCAAAAQPVLSEQPNEFQSRKDIEEKIMMALREKKVKMIGICGMGGIGKTTMAKKVMDRARQENLFDETVIAVVSQTVDQLKIQLDIAEQLGLKDLDELKNLRARANKLSARLNGAKRILVVLDDVWSKLDLVELGICCTVLFTSRTEDELKQMNVEVFSMKILSEEEAWNLFEGKAGDCVTDTNLRSIAKKVAKECQGLPIALVTIGATLKGEDKPIWEDALNRLENSSSSEEVYGSLMLSYDFLKKQEEKLLCSLFPEDDQIHLEDLILYSMGLNMLERVYTLHSARNRLRTIVKTLKSRFLLLGCDGDENNVKMHDVIRDAAISIALGKSLLRDGVRSQNQHDVNCEWISLFPKSGDNSIDHLMESKFPNLRLLVIHFQKAWGFSHLEINDLSFLERMHRLNVLSFKHFSIILPHKVIHFPENLRILRLDYSNLMTLLHVGSLLNLEVLSCHGCRKIKEVPGEIGELKNLKLLDLSKCTMLRKITPRVISKLVELEELKILNSFKGWESSKVNEENRRNASLKELESLRKLSCMEIEIEDESLAEEDICLPSSLVRYEVRIADNSSSIFSLTRDSMQKITVLHARVSKYASWFQNFVNATDKLYLEGNRWQNLDLSHAYKTVEHLEICDFEGLKKLVDSSTMPTCAFALLQWLILDSLPNLMQICDGPIPRHISFNNLEHIQISECNQLQNLMLFERADDVCCKLAEVEISGCDAMKQVFISNESIEKVHLTLSKLKKMRLKSLLNLTSFSKGIESIEFPSLEDLRITECGAMERFVCPMETKRKSPHFFVNQKVKFGMLMWLEIDTCNNVITLFSPSMVQNLTSLETLTIRNCKDMKQVIADEEEMDGISTDECEKTKHVLLEKENEDTLRVIFPKLRELVLGDLPSLMNFVKGIIDSIEFPMLKSVEIQSCPLLGNIVSSTESSEKCEASLNVEIFALFDKDKVKCGELEIFSIESCHNIRNLFSNSMANNLVRLESLSIIDCKRMETVIIAYDEEMEDNCRVIFPTLRQLVLGDFPSLTNFVKGIIDSIEFPMLEELEIRSCPLLGNIVSPTESSEKCEASLNVEISALFDKDKVKCSELKSFSIKSCHNIRNLFSNSMANNLVRLKSLSIRDCKRMETVIIADDDKENHANSLLSPCLEELHLERLPMLRMFCGWKYSLELPLLKTITITGCPQMEFLTHGSLITTPALLKLNVDHRLLVVEDATKTTDLNNFIHQYIISIRESMKGRKTWRRLMRSSPTMTSWGTSEEIDGEGILQLSDPHTNVEKKLSSSMIANIWSDDASKQLEAATQFREFLDQDDSPPIEEVIESGVVPRFVEFLTWDNFPQLQLEAAWALTNIAAGTSYHTEVVIDHGAVPIIVKLLDSPIPRDDVREQAVWALGNVAGNSPECRDLVLGHGALRPLLALLNKHADLSILRIATWTLCNFCGGWPRPVLEQVKPALPVLTQLIQSTDEEVLSTTCWALYYLSSGPNDKIQAVIDSGVVPRLVELLLHPLPSVIIPALKTVGNIVTGDDVQTQYIIDQNALPCLLNLLTGNYEDNIKKEGCWMISNITAGNQNQIQSVIEDNLIGPLVLLLQNGVLDVKKEAARAISNAATRGTHEQIKYLVSQHCIKPLCDMLVCPDPSIVKVCLEGLQNILKVGEAERNAEIMDNAEMLEKIKNLWSYREKSDCEGIQELSDPIPTVRKKLSSSMIASIWSDDSTKQLEAATQFRELLDQGSPPIEEVIESGVVPQFVEFLMRDDIPQLQFEAASVLTNIASGPSYYHSEVVIDYGAVPIFVKLLGSPRDDVRKQAVRALGNAARSSSECHDFVLSHGALHPLLALLNEHADLSMLRIATWTLSKICGGLLPPVFEQVKPALPVLTQLVQSTDEEVLRNTCWALSHLFSRHNQSDMRSIDNPMGFLFDDLHNQIDQALMDSGIGPPLLELLLRPLPPSVIVPALKTVRNIVTGGEMQTQYIIDHKALPCLLNLLTGNYDDMIKAECCGVISYITARNQNQIQSVIEANLIGPLVQLLKNATCFVKGEAAWAISNVASRGTHEQIKYLVSQQCIRPLCDMLVCTDPITLIDCLRGLENIMKVGEAERNIGNNDLYAQTIDNAEMLEKIENLQKHSMHVVHKKAVKILETYWLEEDGELARCSEEQGPSLLSQLR